MRRNPGLRERPVVAAVEIFVARLGVLRDRNSNPLPGVHQNRRHVGKIESRHVRAIEMRAFRRIRPPQLFQIQIRDRLVQRHQRMVDVITRSTQPFFLAAKQNEQDAALRARMQRRQGVGHFQHRRRSAGVIVRSVEDSVVAGLRESYVIVMRAQHHVGVFELRDPIRAESPQRCGTSANPDLPAAPPRSESIRRRPPVPIPGGGIAMQYIRPRYPSRAKACRGLPASRKPETTRLRAASSP